MTGRRAIALVIRRELRETLRSRAFRASVAIQVLLVAGIAVVAIVNGGDDGPRKRDVGVVGAQARAIADRARARERALDLSVRLRPLRDERAARAAVRDGDADVALAGGRLLAPPDPDRSLVSLVQDSAGALRSQALLRRSGLSEGRIEAALEPPLLRTAEVAPQGGEGGKGLAFIGALMLYIAIITFSYTIAGGVVSEKSSRVIEIILSSIRARDLLAGKVIGVGLVGLGQVTVVAGVGLAIALAGGALDLPSSTARAAVLVAVYFLLGYAFYGCAFAGAASIVSRQEDTQSTTAPLLVVLVGSYIASASALGDPSGPVARICTFLPPVAPMVVPGRAAQDALPAWELAVSIALMIVAIVVTIRGAARIYERSGAALRQPAEAQPGATARPLSAVATTTAAPTWPRSRASGPMTTRRSSSSTAAACASPGC